MACSIACIAAHDDASAGIEPAHVSRSRAVNNDLGIGHAHAAHALAGIADQEGQLLALCIPEGTADVVLAGSIHIEICLASGDSLFNGQDKILGRHAHSIVQGMYGKHNRPP